VHQQIVIGVSTAYVQQVQGPVAEVDLGPVGHQFRRRRDDDLGPILGLFASPSTARVPASRSPDDGPAEGADRWPFPPDGLVEAVRRGYLHAG